jgi:hypothetical protein
MATFDVTVKGRDYTVDAANPDDAWVKANQLHEQSEPSIGNMMSNIVPSAKKYGTELVGGVKQMVTHPLDTARSMLDVGAAGLTAALPDKVNEFIDRINWDKDEAQRISNVANAVGGVYKQRYGSVDAMKRTLTTDPVGAFSDISTILTGGGALAGKVPALAKTAATASKIGSAIDPLKVITAPAKAVAPILGFTTGTGTLPMQQAYQAGKAGGEKGEAFLGQLRKTAPIENVVDDARKALDNIKNQRNSDYRSGMVDISKDATVLKFDDIEKALDDVKSTAYYKGALKNPQAAEVFEEIQKAITEWKQKDPAQFHTPEGIDALKQRIGNIQKSYLQPGKEPALRVATAAYNSLKDLIQKQAPKYAEVMANYEKASTELADIEKTLSLGRKASIDTSLRKLQSIMRDEANTNWGRRVNVGRKLEEAGAETLMPQLAGQSLSAAMPRGLSGRFGLTGILGQAGQALTMNPSAFLPIAGKAAALAIPTSPRLMGEAAYYTGKVAGTPARLGKMLSQYGDKLAAQNPKMAFAIDAAQRAVAAGKQVNPQVARMLAIQLARMEQAQQEQ